MATPESERLLVLTPKTPSTAITTVAGSGGRVLRSPLSDEVIWRRLKEAGFDEESIKRRDKSSLIAYIAKLEAEMYDLQYQMGLLLLEKKEWASKFDLVKATADAAELAMRRGQVAHASEMVEVKKREDALRKALGIEKECVANIEKALHEMRAESAETKVAAETKSAEARNMMEDALRKSTEAEAQLHGAESLEAKASGFHRAAERKLREVEEREDDLRRRITALKSVSDAKESEIQLERQSVRERQKVLRLAQEKLLEGQVLFNQREEYIASRSHELNKLEKDLEASKSDLQSQRKALNEEKCKSELISTSLAAREEAVAVKEDEIKKKEKELLLLREKNALKESEEIERAVAKGEAILKSKMSTLEAELQTKQKSVGEEIERKRREWELKEIDLKQKEDVILEQEDDLKVRFRAIMDKEKEFEERFRSLEEKEKSVLAIEEETGLKKSLIQREKEEIESLKLDLQNGLRDLEEKKVQITSAEEKVASMRNDTDELLVLERRLKEEMDMITAQKLELQIEADFLKAEKAKFETEWEQIDEKREELRKEADRVAEERLTIYKYLKDERDTLKSERHGMRNQYKLNLESLARDREAFHSEMERERSDWFNKIQKEREDFLIDIATQKMDLENHIDQRREELESDYRESGRTFEEEKKKELHGIASLKEIVAKEMEVMTLEMKRLDTVRKEINLDREKRDKEQAELNKSIEELKLQQQKLENQRELLHADREEILSQIEQLKKLEDLKYIPDRIASRKVVESDTHSISAKKLLQQEGEIDLMHYGSVNGVARSDDFRQKGLDTVSSPLSTPFTWLKRCADSLLEPTHSNKKRKQEKDVPSQEETPLPSALTMEESTFEVTQAAMPTDHVPVDAVVTKVYVDKKIVTVQEVTSVDVGVVTGESLVPTTKYFRGAFVPRS